MTERIPGPQMSLRQRIAAKVPKGPRKAVRMMLNYAFRLRTWASILRQVRPADRASRKILWQSAASAVLSSFKDLDSFQKPVPIGDLSVDVPGIGRFAARARTDDLFHLWPGREGRVRESIESYLHPGAIFVDGGANIGFYSILAARRIGPKGRVVAFEMMPDTAAVLHSHIAANGPFAIEVIDRALSDQSGNHVRAAVDPGCHGQASIVAVDVTGQQTIEVETVTLDDALSEYGTIAVLKLDLEGAEHAALKGARAVLARTDCVVFENNNQDRRIFDLLANAGFAVAHLEGHDYVALREG